jgi:hypothetical protein
MRIEDLCPQILNIFKIVSHNQREDMGLLVEYKDMPSLRDVAHGGWLCTFTLLYKKQLEIPSARSWAAPVRATGTVRKRQAVLPGHSPQAGQAGHCVGPALELSAS